jgi:hypothetical protein
VPTVPPYFTRKKNLLVYRRFFYKCFSSFSRVSIL